MLLKIIFILLDVKKQHVRFIIQFVGCTTKIPFFCFLCNKWKIERFLIPLRSIRNDRCARLLGGAGAAKPPLLPVRNPLELHPTFCHSETK